MASVFRYQAENHEQDSSEGLIAMIINYPYN